ncbi:hypothetical protein P5F04_08390 [Clostridium perfringens]|nr:hypothetical protein [Clostridium perfringens]MDK0664787.1 hypothetical protein [Clostridium perfringens]
MKKETKEEKKQISEFKFLFIISIILALLMIFLVYIFIDYFYCGIIKHNLDSIRISKDNMMLYFATLGGACFTGIITAAGLYLTLNVQTKQYNTQRKIDKANREEDKNQFEQQLEYEKEKFKRELNYEKEKFEKDYNLKLIIDKLNTCKKAYVYTSKIRKKFIYIYTNIEKKVYEKDSQRLIDDIGVLIEIRDKQYIESIMIDDKKYQEYQEKLDKKINKLFDKTNEDFNIDDIKGIINDIGILLKEQLENLIEITRELNNKKYR